MGHGKKYKVKICGMKYPENIREVSELAPDYLGFIFHPKSSRYCREEGKEILSYIEGDTIPVMVSVNMPEKELIEIVAQWGFRIVQLHGNETPDQCNRLRDRGLEVWKAIPIGSNIHMEDNSCFDKTELYEGKIDKFLFDTATKEYGGSGKRFNWDLLKSYKGSTPFMLSGGISPGDELQIRSISHSLLFGVDLNSRFEIMPGLKDSNMISTFLSALNNK